MLAGAPPTTVLVVAGKVPARVFGIQQHSVDHESDFPSLARDVLAGRAQQFRHRVVCQPATGYDFGHPQMRFK